MECGADVDEEDEENDGEEECGGPEDEMEELLGREGAWTRHAEKLKGAFQNANPRFELCYYADEEELRERVASERRSCEHSYEA